MGFLPARVSPPSGVPEEVPEGQAVVFHPAGPSQLTSASGLGALGARLLWGLPFAHLCQAFGSG